MTRQILLELDELDYDAVQWALAVRQRARCMPNHDSSTAGALVAEICRGWLESIGELRVNYDEEGET